MEGYCNRELNPTSDNGKKEGAFILEWLMNIQCQTA
jgi:hypothetical protein